MEHSTKYQYFVILSIACYRLNDCLTKFLVSDLGTFETLFFRSLFTLVLLPIFLFYVKIDYKLFFDKVVFSRNVLAAIALFLEVASLEYLSLSTFILLLYSVPIFMKIFARILLHERISMLDSGVIVVSIIGTLFILDVSLAEESTLGVVYALLGALIYAFSAILTKKIKDPDSNSIYFSYVIVLFLISTLRLPEMIPTVPEMTILFAMALIHIAAFMLYLKGFLALKTSRAAVLEYLGLVFALILDFVFWNKLPVLPQVLGGVLIVGASLISVYRENAILFLKKIIFPRRRIS